jgi:hypothetical protein
MMASTGSGKAAMEVSLRRTLTMNKVETVGGQQIVSGAQLKEQHRD